MVGNNRMKKTLDVKKFQRKKKLMNNLGYKNNLLFFPRFVKKEEKNNLRLYLLATSTKKKTYDVFEFVWLLRKKTISLSFRDI